MNESVSREGSAAQFQTTHWSVVLKAVEGSSATTHALESLCRTYWYPLYAFLRRRGHPAPEAQDLTQEFLAQLLGGDSLRHVHPDKGCFRSYLLGGMKRFLAKEWRDAHRLKRGGGCQLLS